jgi:hypothetical protein
MRRAYNIVYNLSSVKITLCFFVKTACQLSFCELLFFLKKTNYYKNYLFLNLITGSTSNQSSTGNDTQLSINELIGEYLYVHLNTLDGYLGQHYLQ